MRCRFRTLLTFVVWANDRLGHGVSGLQLEQIPPTVPKRHVRAMLCSFAEECPGTGMLDLYRPVLKINFNDTRGCSDTSVFYVNGFTAKWLNALLF